MIPELTHWESYYVIVGSSAAALTGLQFVVMTLISESTIRATASDRTISAFGTPTIVHFCVALLISAIISAPWHSIASVAWASGIIGAGGLVYDALVIRRAKGQTEYRPVFEDWLWHTVLPILSHAGILVAGLMLLRGPAGPLFAIGGAALLLLFIGIHNSWDTVTYLTVGRPALQAGREREGNSPSQ
jgi:hypothetical protein